MFEARTIIFDRIVTVNGRMEDPREVSKEIVPTNMLG